MIQMNNLKSLQYFAKRLIFGIWFFASFNMSAQTADLSLAHVQMPDTVVLGDTIIVSAYLKNNSDSELNSDNISLSYYVNEVQDTEKAAVIQSEAIEGTVVLAVGDSVFIEQQLVVDDLLFQIGENQDIQKNIVIVWPTEDNYSINYHLQPLVVLKQAIPEAVFNASSDFDAVTVNDVAGLPLPTQELIANEYAGFDIEEIEQQNFGDGSIQFEVKLSSGDEEIRLYFSEEGILVLIETHKDESILPTTVTDFIALNYPSPPYLIDEVSELLYNDGTIQYKVELINENDDEDEPELYFDAEGENISSPGIEIELYEEAEIEIGGISLPNNLVFDDQLTVDGTLTNNLDVVYNDVTIPINYASVPFPPSLTDFKLKTEVSSIDEIQPQETVAFQQSFPVMEDLFHVGRNIVIVWPTDYLMDLRANCVSQEIFVEMSREDTVGIETLPALSNEVFLAPNPTLQYLNIKTNQLEIESVSIYDMAAKPIEQFEAIRQSHFQTDVSHLNNGMYLLYIQTTEGNAVKKLVVGD